MYDASFILLQGTCNIESKSFEWIVNVGTVWGPDMADFIWIYYLISVDSTIAALTGNFSIPYPCFTLQLTSPSHCSHFIANSSLYLTYSSLLLAHSDNLKALRSDR